MSLILDGFSYTIMSLSASKVLILIWITFNNTVSHDSKRRFEKKTYVI